MWDWKAFCQLTYSMVPKAIICRAFIAERAAETAKVLKLRCPTEEHTVTIAILLQQLPDENGCRTAHPGGDGAPNAAWAVIEAATTCLQAMAASCFPKLQWSTAPQPHSMLPTPPPRAEARCSPQHQLASCPRPCNTSCADAHSPKSYI